MEFAVIAYDATDAGALERRMSVREAHLALVKDLRAKGHMTHGGAILNDDGTMIGSVMIVEFDDKAGCDAWLAQDPYVTGKVWENITVVPYKTAPSFIGNLDYKKASVQ